MLICCIESSNGLSISFFLINLVAPDIKLVESLQFNTNDVIMQLRHPACFINLCGRVYLTFLRCQKITFGGADIQISTEAMCLGVLLDSRLTFAPHIRRISGRCFYHLRQLRVVRKSLTVEAAKTMVNSFVVA